MGQYLPILALLVLAVVFAGVSLVAQRILVPRRPNEAKNAPYECGILDVTEPPERFPVRFFLVAMIFIVFDIEIVFLYPLAVAFGQMKLFGLVEMILFVVPVFVAYWYVWRRGGLDWD